MYITYSTIILACANNVVQVITYGTVTGTVGVVRMPERYVNRILNAKLAILML